MCEHEPLVDVYMGGKDRVTYSYVTPDRARQIVARHIVDGQVIDDWVLAAR
jgi:NADP-reducing hydrogenase subunit HndB